jgi:hypothetical protein
VRRSVRLSGRGRPELHQENRKINKNNYLEMACHLLYPYQTLLTLPPRRIAMNTAAHTSAANTNARWSTDELIAAIPPSLRYFAFQPPANAAVPHRPSRRLQNARYVAPSALATFRVR